MEEEKAGEIAALVIAAVSLTMCAFRWDWKEVGLYPGCGTANRLIWPFVHAGVVHALLNMWCLLAVVFIHRVGAWLLLAAYASCILFPECLMADKPTVGFSGAVFFLFGSVSLRVRRKLYWLGWMAFYLAAGFVMPATDGFIHLWCYLWGIVAALLDKPWRRLRP